MPKTNHRIITIGLSPAWDVTCCGEHIEWGRHCVVEQFTKQPAGKSLNVSKALCWMGSKSIAAGLWGQQDYKQMREYLKNEYRLVQSYHTLAAAGTRENITVLDRRGFREMHLRNKNELADTGAVKKLQKDLEKLLKKDDVCVFSGSISEGIIEEIYKILALCRQAGAKIVLDTSGDALVKLAGCGLIDIVKPNIQEFEQITGEKFDTGSLLNDKTKLENIKAGRILISCGADGAVMICGEERFKCRVKDSKEVLSTVACGDYFLAGYLWAAKQGFDEKRAVQCAVKAGTAKAWQMTDKFSWDEVLGKIETEIIA